MKRSEINARIRRSKEFLRRMQFHLPPFADWSPEDWAGKGPECADIVRQGLGWDITDFGSGDFPRIGLTVFVIRNGTFAELAKPQGKVYAEKILIVEEEQVTPTHFHFQKMEDIINRGGGDLVIRFWNADADDTLADTRVDISVDGERRTIAAGDTITLRPGESVCIPQRLYHRFWGRKGGGTVLVGEVSRVNDDNVDNHFFPAVGRFPAIEEDEPPVHLLFPEYPRWYRHSV